MRTSVKNLLKSATALDSVELAGWVRTRRDSKEFSFMELNDGSCLKGIQVIIDSGTPGSEEVGKMNTGASVKVAGELVESPGEGQSWEVRATEVELIGGVPDDSLFKRRATRLSFCAPLLICVRGQIFTERLFGCGAVWLMPCIDFLTSGISPMFTRLLLPRVIARGQVRCFR